MKCPACGSRAYRAVITNNLIDSQTMRKRRCQSCGHVWFTVELPVPEQVVGWSPRHEGKPVLRAAITLMPEHIEAQGRVTDCHSPTGQHTADGVP